MEKYFNTEGLCNPRYHYMVPLDDRLYKIRQRYVERGSYFVINRGRQYGKTTTLRALAEYLQSDYIVLSIDFQEIGTAEFQDEGAFCKAFAEVLIKACRNNMRTEEVEELFEPLIRYLKEIHNFTMREMFEQLSQICEHAPAPIVMMIDEVDSASNYQVFLDFLALLRGYYLNRENTPIFHSVILAGVYDIKNLKLKIRSDREHKYNSPWNIAAKYNLEMSFSAAEISSMLWEYESDHHTGMNVEKTAELIYDYTSGYPYLVSAICKLLDEEISGSEGFEETGSVWTAKGVMEAVSRILDERIPLFESMMRQLAEYPDIKRRLYVVLFQGKRIAYNPDNFALNLSEMFGYIVKKNGSVQVANRMFEMRLYSYFLSEEELTSAIGDEAQKDRNRFLESGRLNMRLILERFVEHFADIYGDNDGKFVEEQGRKLFLLYLKPVINGTGNYYIEAQTRDARRTDVIVDYLGEQFIIELKIWHGNEYNERGEKQLADYLEYYHQNKGYMLSFNFNRKKQRGVKEIQIDGKTIIEAVV